MNILGLSAYYHDSAACLVQDGDIAAAAQEERFTRKKHDHAFPANAIRYCLAEGGLSGDDLDVVVFYEKPITKFVRILQTYFAVAPRGLKPFLEAVPLWAREKLWTPLKIEQSLAELGVRMPEKLYFPTHHQSHAASAFFPSPFESAAIVTTDGVGEWDTTTVGVGEGNRVTLLKQVGFPHSLGLLYSAFTYFTGFRVLNGEYKMMGLAPYGEPRYAETIREHLVDVRDDGSFRLNLRYFGYLDSLTMTNGRFEALFGGPPRERDAPITRRETDLAASCQAVTEEILFKVVRHAAEVTQEQNLCLAGGVALNCVANGKLLRDGPFENIWIQPAAGDAGGALGAALFVWHQIMGEARDGDGTGDRMKGAYLGPAFPEDDIEEFLKANGCPYRRLADDEWARTIARLIADEKVVGLFQGRMEWGPRALGNRSIVADARSPRTQSVLNLKIKHRESFRPFAPSVMVERVGDYFELDKPSPYMLLVSRVRKERCLPPQGDEADISLKEWVNRERSDVPAITHVDYSARVQTVDRQTNPRYYELLQAFEELTGCGLVVNTSFNERGEPIVCTPSDAYDCFMRTEMDYLVLERFLLAKAEQPQRREAIRRALDEALD
ncbi:MAG: carbamoyltransferase family protein [Planctomycetota bacterium]|jgi:carbamoyltransferase